MITSARTESRGAFYFNSLLDSQFHIVGKAPVLSFTRAVLADVQAYDNTGVLRFMSARNGKPCKKCGGTEWYKNGHCVLCTRARSRKEAAANPEKNNVRSREWRAANPGKVAANNKRWNDANPDKRAAITRKWQTENPEKVAAFNRKWAAENPEKVSTRGRKWAAENPEKRAASSQKWKQSHPEVVNATSHRHRTRKTEADGSYTAAEWKALVEHYGGKCLCCGRDNIKLSADHVIPVAKGGSSNIDNIQPLCKSCNSRKGDKTINYRPDSGLGR